MRLISRFALLAALALAPLVASAHDYSVGALKIDHPWARATPGAITTGAVYLSVTATGDAPDRLIGAATPRAAKAELHTQIMDGDVMKMRTLSAIEINPGEPAVLKPGSLHIMLVGLTAPLREKDRFPLTLTFEKAGKVDVDVLVESAGARDAGHDGKGMPGNHMGH
ncbi:MAG TPA: copper chaperone PCu(A)C [Alphaproteobacteria bacterium]|nr:copper chaperone PCu(A)C [Alphaproteobacteria bacterium]